MSTPPLRSRTATTVTLDGRELLSFAGCDYLGLATNPRLADAAHACARECGLSSSASRETSGSFEVHERLESALAEFLGTEAALLAGDGTLADLALLQGLADRVRVVLIDADAHASLFDAARLTGVQVYDYGRGDLNRAYALVDRFRDQGLALLTDGVFPMSGRIAAVNELLRVLPAREAWLVVDDSHALGVLSATGRGSLEVHGLSDPRLVVTASLGKALGVAGGFLAGAHDVVARVRRRSDVHVGSTPMPPPAAAAALAALDVVQKEPARLERLHANIAQLQRMGRRLGLHERGTFLPVLPVPIDDAAAGERAQKVLLERGLFVPFVRYPATAPGGALRIAVGSEHTSSELRRLEQALSEVLA